MASGLESRPFNYLQNIVEKPTWKEVLLDLIHSNSIDPWNIDIHQLADAFMKKIKELESVDFALEANVILAAAILLKYKSEYLRSLSIDPNQQTALDDYLPDERVPIDEIPQLAFASRIPPKRQITLEELMGEMERIIKYDDENRIKIPKGSIVDTVDLELSEHDVDHDIDQLFQQIKQNTDAQGWSLFSKLTTGKSMREVVYSLLCLLYLAQRQDIDIRQDDMFGEIFIKILDKKSATSESSAPLELKETGADQKDELNSENNESNSDEEIDQLEE